MRKEKGRHASSLFLFALFLVLFSVLDAEAKTSGYGRLNSFTYSEPVSIDAAKNKWDTDRFEGGKHQWSSHWFELGVQYNDWHLGYLKRLEIDLNFSRDTAEYYYRTENDLPLRPNYTYQLQLEAQQVELDGLRFGRFHQIRQGLTLDWGLSLLNADDLIDGSVRGTEQQLDLDYHYSEDTILDREVARPDGQGISFDLLTDWQINDRTSLTAQIDDMLGWVRWKDAPFTTATASADQNTYDNDGVLVVKPLLTGIEGIDGHYTQRLTPKARIDLRRQFGKVAANLGYYRREQVNLWFLGGELKPTDTLAFGINLWPQMHSIELYTRWKKLSFAVAVDSTEWEHMNTLWLNVRYQ